MYRQVITFFKRSNDLLQRRAALLTLALIHFAADALGQNAGAGVAAFEAAASAISNYEGPVKKLIYVIAGVLALVGSFNVFMKMQNGDQDVKKTAMLTLGGCVALVVLAETLPLFFR